MQEKYGFNSVNKSNISLQNFSFFSKIISIKYVLNEIVSKCKRKCKQLTTVGKIVPKNYLLLDDNQSPGAALAAVLSFRHGELGAALVAELGEL